jgi:hypothetical protein
MTMAGFGRFEPAATGRFRPKSDIRFSSKQTLNDDGGRR